MNLTPLTRAAGMIFGEWKSRILCAGVKLGVMEALHPGGKSAPSGGRIFVIKHIVPGPETPHFAKLYGIHMVCWGPGRERTAAEYARLLEEAGWSYAGTRPAGGGMMGLVEGLVPQR